MTNRERKLRAHQEQTVKIPVEKHFKNLRNRSPKPFRRLMASLACTQLRAWGYNV